MAETGFLYDAWWAERSGSPDTPGANYWKLFTKADGFYSLDDAGTAARLLTTADAGGTYLALAGGTMSGAVNFADQELSRPLLKDYGETLQAHGNTGTTETLNIEDGNVHSITLDDNCTLTFSNPSATGRACSFTLVVTQDGGGGNTITWPASVDWAGGTPPTLSAAGSAKDVLTFLTLDAGTTWLGFLAGLAFA